MTNKEGLCLECPPRMHAPSNIKQDNNSLVCESQPVEKFCLARALWPHVKARREARKLLDAQIAAGEVQP